MERLARQFFVPATWGKGAAALFCRTVLLPVCLAILLSGCAQLQIAGPDAAGMTSTVVTRLDAESIFAAAPGGSQVAFSSGGVRVMPLPSGESRSLSAERPLALAWSPDGGKLAVAFGRGTGSRIAIFGVDGVFAAETTPVGRVGALFWTDSDVLLAVTMELEPFKFGTTCREVLLRWKLAGVPERTLLHETTLKPYTVRKLAAGMLIRAISPAISPLGDELVYGRIQDPPAFDAYMKVMVRNLSSGAEREIAKTGFGDGAARFSADGEELFIASGSGQIRRIAPWSGTEKPAAPFSGRVLAVSPDGRHLLADGRLLDNGREAALFP
ncbi:MAG: hypothetical protein WA003_09225, partial [Desulfuromonadaceae bacterium]